MIKVAPLIKITPVDAKGIECNDKYDAKCCESWRTVGDDNTHENVGQNVGTVT